MEDLVKDKGSGISDFSIGINGAKESTNAGFVSVSNHGVQVNTPIVCDSTSSLASDSGCFVEPVLQTLEVGSAADSAESVLQTLEGSVAEHVLSSMSDDSVDSTQQKHDEPVLPPRTRSSRVIKLPQKYADYQVNMPKAKTTPHTMAQVVQATNLCSTTRFNVSGWTERSVRRQSYSRIFSIGQREIEE
ncbi:hypothetical protein V6N11_056463 [Hibiscus sabdariffa]|uniref:Uncharacterized protein n=1 Tax=Hibiscus sabdariffa TaxID=183260 RepID=A0ABR2T4M1_9ROSI